MRITKAMIEHVVNTLVGEEALDIVWYLKGKTRISEFIIAEELDLEIHRTRNLLYRLLEHNIVYFHRKKDKIKGWYICYWDFHEKIIPHLIDKIRNDKLAHMQERLSREEDRQFYMCRNACARMDFEKSIEFNFKCPECGEIMNLQDNLRTIQFLKERIKELQEEAAEAEKEAAEVAAAAAKTQAEAAAKAEKEAAEAAKKKLAKAVKKTAKKAPVKKADKKVAKKTVKKAAKKPTTKKVAKKATKKMAKKKVAKKK